MTRALARAGIEVHVLEADRALPGLRSRFGRKHLVDDINGPGLVQALLVLRERVAPETRPVLFVMNDRMVRTLAADIVRVTAAYRLSWAPQADEVAALTDKSVLAAHCLRAGLDYPQTVVVHSLDEVAALAGRTDWPRILKPARPLSGFKVHVATSAADALDFLQAHAADFPVLVQQWIEGDAKAIRFCALYLEGGRPIARFEGRKLRAEPMGNTTVAEPARHDAVFDCARRFFAGTGLTGPVSLELKFDPSGRPWVIEPTVGRTDFWIDLCVANGVNLPLIEYHHQADLALPEARQSDRRVWVNASSDFAALAWYALNFRRSPHLAFALRFAYLDWADSAPFWSALEGLGSHLVAMLTR